METTETRTCPRCHKSFNSAQALRMHHIRIHTRAGRLGAIKGVQMSKQRKRPAKINPRQPQWKTREYRHRKYREQVERYHARGLNAHGQPFKDSPITRGMLKARGQRVRNPRFVYPVPSENGLPVTPGRTVTTPTGLTFCPHCGENLSKWTRGE